MTPPSASAAGGRESLALLYQGILTAIVRIQSGRERISDANAFRKRIRDVLFEIEREAIRVGYSSQDISDTTYAVIAFLDEAILNSSDPSRQQWSSLQSELYGQAVGGNAFFDQMKRISARRDAAQLADILEVYQLCLLLGYQGRYSDPEYRGELKQILQDLRERVESIRGPNAALSPAAIPPGVPVQPADTESQTAMPAVAILAPVAALTITGASWLIYRLLLGFQSDEVRRAVLNTLVP